MQKRFSELLPLGSKKMKRGFTLVEILAVIAIVAALSGTLFSALGTSKGRAKIVSCATNLNQIGKALILYSGDHDDALPPLLNLAGGRTINTGLQADANPWASAVLPYIRSTAPFYCPEDRLARFQHGDASFARVDHRMTSYAHAPWLEKRLDADGVLRMQFSDVEEPASASHLVEDGVGIDDLTREILQPHGGRSNVLFFDGHVSRPAVERESAHKAARP